MHRPRHLLDACSVSFDNHIVIEDHHPYPAAASASSSSTTLHKPPTPCMAIAQPASKLHTSMLKPSHSHPLQLDVQQLAHEQSMEEKRHSSGSNLLFKPGSHPKSRTLVSQHKDRLASMPDINRSGIGSSSLKSSTDTSSSHVPKSSSSTGPMSGIYPVEYDIQGINTVKRAHEQSFSEIDQRLKDINV